MTDGLNLQKASGTVISSAAQMFGCTQNSPNTYMTNLSRQANFDKSARQSALAVPVSWPNSEKRQTNEFRASETLNTRLGLDRKVCGSWEVETYRMLNPDKG